MRNLRFQFKQMCRHMKSGAFATQASMARLFAVIADDLDTLGFRNLDIKSLKPKHVAALVDHWKNAEYATGSIKNLMTAVRRWSEYIGK